MSVPWIKQRNPLLETMNSIVELEEFFEKRSLQTYSRENYDKYLKKEGFVFDIPSIHITGTNGKGSTAKYLYEIYKAQGYKVGLFSSPSTTTLFEMIQVDGKEISSDDYLSLFNRLEEKFLKYELSTFEMQTIMALTYFKDHKLDIAIIEVGMGGYIDATNIFIPKLSIITSVSLEHTAYLGKSISEIADNKAGIIKRDVPVLLGKLDENAMFAIRQRAKETESQIIIVEDYHNEQIGVNRISFDYRPYKGLELSTSAVYQLKNASLAVEATKILKDVFSVSEEAVRKGLNTKLLPCRFEYVKKNVMVDGAHNPEAMKCLTETLSKVEHRPIHVVFAAFRDKNIDQMLIALGSISNDVVLTTFKHKRARTEEEYFLYLGDYKFVEDYLSYIKELETMYPDDLILVTGSLCFAGIVREALRNEK